MAVRDYSLMYLALRQRGEQAGVRGPCGKGRLCQMVSRRDPSGE